MDIKNIRLIGIFTLCILAIVCLTGSIGYNFNSKNKAQDHLIEYERESETITEETTEVSTIIVYITGEIEKPDVYTMPEGARLVDLIEKAGGFTQHAYRDNLNLAMRISDGEKIVIDNVNDVVDKNLNLDENIESGSSGKEELININTADANELQKLSGIGESLSEAIIVYRDKYGDFTSIEEIKEVDGIGNSIFEKIKDDITVYR